MDPTLREQIDNIDDRLIKLFGERMDVAARIAEYKKEHNIPVLDRKRETEKLKDIMDKVPDDLKEYAAQLYSMMFEFSRSYQTRLIGYENSLTDKIKNALKSTPELFPDKEVIACQGIEGANSHIAANKLFRYPNVMFFKSFESVFSAVDKGLCRYGIIPLENSTAGSVNSVYDLMMRYKFSIVRSLRLKVDHNLLLKV